MLGVYLLFMGLTRIAVAFRGQQGAGLVGLSGICGLADRHPRLRRLALTSVALVGRDLSRA